MRTPVHLWILTIDVPIDFGDILSDLFTEEAVALTVLAPPRQINATVEAIFDHEPNLDLIKTQVALFAALHGVKVGQPQVKPMPPLDWLKKVASDFPPIKIGRWTIHGALHRDKVPTRLNALQIDATNAFGTGEHPTTRGCLLMLDKILKNGFRPSSIADIGCGSGVLAMGCIQASRGHAVAVDLDADSVQIAAGNARRNGLGRCIRVSNSRGYVAPIVARHAPYDLIMANIFAKPLSQMAKDLKKNLKPQGIAILSGLLNTQANMVIAAHRMQNLALIEHKKIGEWSVLAFRRHHRAL